MWPQFIVQIGGHGGTKGRKREKIQRDKLIGKWEGERKKKEREEKKRKEEEGNRKIQCYSITSHTWDTFEHESGHYQYFFSGKHMLICDCPRKSRTCHPSYNRCILSGWLSTHSVFPGGWGDRTSGMCLSEHTETNQQVLRLASDNIQKVLKPQTTSSTIAGQTRKDLIVIKTATHLSPWLNVFCQESKEKPPPPHLGIQTPIFPHLPHL